MTDTEIVTVHVSFHIRKRGGRKEMILPDAALTKHRHVDNTLIKGLARAFRWKRMLDTGACPTLGDLAAHGQSPKLQYLATVGLLTIPERKISCFILWGKSLGGKLHEHSDFVG